MDIITNFSSLEDLLLPSGCHFSEDARDVINCWESKEILACPGSGKTTVLIAKLKLIADQLPFSDGRGVCVLSHTNIAVEEMKKKLGKSAEKLFLYPNFIGTIQTFIDQYVAFPYLRQFVQNSIQVVSDDEFYNYLIILIKKHTSLFRFFNMRRGEMALENFLKNLYIDDNGDVKTKISKKTLLKNDNENGKIYKEIIKSLHVQQGIFRYQDAYWYADKALDEYGDIICRIISNRFAFTFVDEYQDCSLKQQEILNKIFLNYNTIFQKIGDVDQAIYHGEDSHVSSWDFDSEYLSIKNSNRYGQEIANVLTRLRTDQENIISTKSYINILPTLLVYDNDTKSKVIPLFIEEIKNNNLVKNDGIYKAIGMVENVSGLKISDYWDGFIKNSQYKTKTTYSNFIKEINEQLNNGNLFLVELVIRKLLCYLFYIIQKKDNNQKYYTVKKIKTYLDDDFNDLYKDKILELMQCVNLSNNKIDTVIKSLVTIILKQDSSNSIIEKFMNFQDQYTIPKNNIYFDDNNLPIVFDTVYGVKGETHDATLYLETEWKRGSDILRIMKIQQELAKGTVSDIYHKSRKCVYVGWSRPRSLLCVAIRKETYEKSKDYFKNWKIVEL